jgi:hypothetical protein
MRRQFIWMQAALCAVTFSVTAPALARANNGQPPPHAQANGHDKNKHKDKDKDKAKPPKTATPSASQGWDQRFHGLDSNHNNVVSRSEWNGDDRSFANHDWNRDGVLSGDELRAGATRPTSPQATRPASPQTPRPHTESDEVLFARMDANRDNSLSRGEWNGSASDFDRLDFNRDGVLSPYEFGVGR